jgi:lipopolysaccharide biosynthesis protein
MPPEGPLTRVALPNFVSADRLKEEGCEAGPSNFSSEVQVGSPGRYILALSPTDRRIPFLRLTICLPGQPDKAIYVPVTRRASYLLQTTRPYLALRIDKKDIVAASIRPVGISDLGALLRRRSRQRRFQVPLAEGIVLRPLLHIAGPEGRDLSRGLRDLTGWGFGVASDNLQRTLSRCLEGPSLQLPRTARVGGPNIAVVLHLHYPDLWPEFQALLEAIDRPFHLILTLTRADAAFEERVKAGFRDAEIIVYDNRGRDIGPFLQVLREGRLDRFDLICKLHGKKSALSGPRMILGDIWRQASSFDLIGSSDVVDRIIAEFERSPEIEMTGSRRFLLPNEWKGERASWGENKAMILSLLAKMGIETNVPVKFVAGTMFWVRRSALERLRQLDLSLSSFPSEDGQQDGALQHALERLLGMICTEISGTAWDDEDLNCRVIRSRSCGAVLRACR